MSQADMRIDRRVNWVSTKLVQSGVNLTQSPIAWPGRVDLDEFLVNPEGQPGRSTNKILNKYIHS